MRALTRQLSRMLFIAAVSMFANFALADTGSDEKSIRHILLSTWDKPEAPLQINYVAVVSNHALAGWTQGTRGGRALMFKQASGEWMVQACGGDGLKEIKTLEQSDIASADAKALAERANVAEKTLPDTTRKLLSTFDQQPAAMPAPHHHHADHSAH